jgi:diguanylate cyclase (GGDEF)-like protein
MIGVSELDEQMSDPSAEEVRAGGGRTRTCLHYRLAAILFIGGGFAAIPPDILQVSNHPSTIFLLPALAFLSGAVAWAASDRAPAAGLHVVAGVATLEVALTVAFASTVFATYYMFIAVFVAYVFEDRRAIAAQIGFAVLAVLAPIFYDPDLARELTIQALVLIPTLVIAGGMVTYLREQLAASEERYRDLSERDPLTGVGNYRMMGQRVPRELRRHARYGRPLALIVIDLDDFKQVNDVLGHQRGDLVLREVADALVDEVRDHDIVIRQGGDEFAVIAPETSLEDALQLAERVRLSVAAISADGKLIGASIGCAHFPADSDTFEGLLGKADERLRTAKVEGLPRYRRQISRAPTSA